MSVITGVGVVAFGGFTGVMSALFGVGGGIVMVPFMTIALDLSQHTAEGTSLLVIVPTALAGVLAHRRRQQISLRHVLLLAAGGVIGSVAGASFALGIEGEVLEQIFGVVLALVGLRVVWTGVRGVWHSKSAAKEGGVP
jgi:uncharacterized membrane protein YfcA